jgi:hypothetical protein
MHEQFHSPETHVLPDILYEIYLKQSAGCSREKIKHWVDSQLHLDHVHEFPVIDGDVLSSIEHALEQ